MSSRPQTPPHHDIPTPTNEHMSRGYGPGSGTSPSPGPGAATVPTAADFGSTPGHPTDSSPLSQSTVQNHQPTRFQEEFSRPVSSVHDGGSGGAATAHTDGVASETKNVQRADSTISNSNTLTPSRGGTLKKKGSLHRKSSLKRSGSTRSNRAGSVRSLAAGDKDKYAPTDEMRSALYTPVPTSGNPTEILTTRFQTWRKVLKDLITYFREIQLSHEHRSKALLKVSNVLNNTGVPPVFMAHGGLGDAVHILRNYHKQSVQEGNRAKEIENDVITQLTGLRADLNQKIKEIKNLSGDFKNSVDREMEGTRKAVHDLQESLDLVESDSAGVAGRDDPFIVKLGTEKQIERQIDEENYLHKAFLNLEGSGRELESIVVGEIQKAYNAYAGILKREADESYEAVEKLREGPIDMAKDHEWSTFVERDNHFVDPRIPLRRPEDIVYPGRDNPAASEVRAGMLERKSKYLKSYTPGWYVLSTTHIHEFKSADRINSQPPVMSLYLPEQKLGTHSQAGSSSHKFILKGRQTGSMHRGHAWTFRAESHDTMLAWYEDLQNLTEKTGAERNAFVRKHARSVSAGSQHSQKAGSVSSDGVLDEDEADDVPYSAVGSVQQPIQQQQSPLQRPQPGGRFPSDIQVDRGLQATRSASSGSSDHGRDVIAAAGALPGTAMPAEGDSTAANPTTSSPSSYKHAGQPVAGMDRFSNAGNNAQSNSRFGADEPLRPVMYGSQPIPQSSQSEVKPTDYERQQSYNEPIVPVMYPSQPVPQSSRPEGNDERRQGSDHGDLMGPGAIMSGGLGSSSGAGADADQHASSAQREEDNARDAPILINHEALSDSSTSARPQTFLASEATSQADSGSTAPTVTDTSPASNVAGSRVSGGLWSKIPSQSNGDGYMAAGGSSTTPTATAGIGPTTTSPWATNPEVGTHLHMPGEYPPTPAA